MMIGHDCHCPMEVSSSSSSISSSSYHPGCINVCDPMPAQWDVTIPWDETGGNACQFNIEGTVRVYAESVYSADSCGFSSKEKLTVPLCGSDYNPCTFETDQTPAIGNTVRLFIQKSGSNRVYFVTCYVWSGSPAAYQDHFGPISIIVPLTDDCTNTVTKTLGAGWNVGCEFETKNGDLVVAPVL
jgi:hypothetical protein